MPAQRFPEAELQEPTVPVEAQLLIQRKVSVLLKPRQAASTCTGVGEVVGAEEGNAEGAAEGLLDGLFDGVVLGEALGESVGA